MLARLLRALKGTKEQPSPKPKDWHRQGVGGLWDEIGQLQFDFLVKQGLQPDHYLLDVGCGSLRGGVHFIKYLDAGRYYGVEKEQSLIDAGREVELKRYSLEHKDPQLLQADDFDLSAIPAKIGFDFMLALSVFTHLKPEMIQLCLERVMPRLKAGGVFYATFDESPDGQIRDGGAHSWRRNELRIVFYPFSLFEELAEKTGVVVDYVGDWEHPRNQKMLAFRGSKSVEVCND